MHTLKGNTSKVAQMVRNINSICELCFLSLYVNFGNKPTYTIFESFLRADFHCTHHSDFVDRKTSSGTTLTQKITEKIE